VGYLVTRSPAWIWLIMGLWLLVFPKGIRDQKFPLLAGLVGMIGLALVIVAVLADRIPQNTVLIAAGMDFGIMLLITIMSLTMGQRLLEGRIDRD
jgi:hypothetical protein